MISNMSAKEPIAIIGSGCRFPGEANSPSKLWDLLHHPRDLSKKPPLTRFNADGFYHPDGEHQGTANVTNSYFLEEDHRVFDTAFFNITPKEAEAIDPQQRLLLETVFEAMESSGLTLKGLQGSQTSAYVGLMCNDWADLQLRDPHYLPQYTATGASRAIISNRLSYFYDWRGPSMTIDTACSSSLVAIHQAVQSLRSGESSVACAAGANLLLGPENYLVESSLHMLSPSGKSQMWDANADGYARGEAIAAVFLKTLSKAIADGDHIESIIRETGVNSDGRTKGITMPSSEAQSALIRETYRKAALDPMKSTQRCQYFEAHGTGTPAGDPKEASAISSAFFDATTGKGEKLFVGSIKTIVGHTEGAAGIAGVLKASLALQNRIIPPNQHLQILNPNVEPFYKNLQIPTSPIPWPTPPAGTPYRASVNSFGFGGTNCHAILELFDPSIHVPEYTVQSQNQSLEAVSDKTPILPLLLSAGNDKALVSMIESYSSYLKDHPSVNLRDLVWTLQARRSALSVKIAFSSMDKEDLIAQMDKQVQSAREMQGGAEIGIRTKLLKPEAGPRILGVFTGQGSQWATMGRALILQSDLFRSTMEKLERSLAELPEPPSWSIQKELMAPQSESRLNEAMLSQPLCTAIQVGLVDLLAAAGVSFHTVIGHSSGEIGAAYAAGYLTASDAIRVAHYRGHFAKLAKGKNGGNGSMMAVSLSMDDAASFCNQPQFHDRIVVAASNSPTSVTLSGDSDAITEAKTALDTQGKFTRILKVDTAYHSPHMISCSEPYLAALASCKVRPQKPKASCTWLSSVYTNNGRPALSDLAGPYWRDNMVNTVLFAQALRAALDQYGPFDVGLEVGPHAALKGPVTQTMKEVYGNSRPYQSAMNRQEDDVVAFTNALGFLWARLGPNAVDFEGYAAAMGKEHSSSKPKLLKDLPLYPWEHGQVYMHESRISKQYRLRSAPHELLGTRRPGDTDHELQWRNLLKVEQVPWLKDHRFQGQILVPAAAYCVMVLEAARAMYKELPIRLVEIQDLDLQNAITLKEDSTATEVLFTLKRTNFSNVRSKKDEEIRGEYSCIAGPADGSSPFKIIFTGKLSIHLGESSKDALPAKVKLRPMLYPVDLNRFYSSMNDIGLNYSGSFRGILSAERRMYMSSARVHSPLETDTSLLVHPIMLDVCFQAIFAAYSSPGDSALWTSFLPRKIGRLTFDMAECSANAKARAKVNVDAYVTNRDIASEGYLPSIRGDIHIFNERSGRMQMQIEDFVITSFTASKDTDRELYAEDKWETDISSDVMLAKNKVSEAPCHDLIEKCERLIYRHLRRISKEVPNEDVIPALKNFISFADHATKAASAGDHSQKRNWMHDIEDDMEVITQGPQGQAQLEMIAAVAESLPAILRGEKILLDDENLTSMMDRFFASGLGFAPINNQLTRTARQIAHKYPRMKIIEIGGGPGNSTPSVLQGLGEAFSSYTFTHSSQASLDVCKDKLRDLSPKLSFRELDIGKDLIEQGFSDHSYDMLIASSTLTATTSLPQSLENARRLLKPGGYVLLTEPTGSLSRHAFIMSCLPGYWSNQEHGPALNGSTSPVQWDTMLRDAGFSGVDAIFPDFADESAHMYSFMLSQAMNDQVQFLRQPLQSSKGSGSADHVLIIGGKSLDTARMMGNISMLLSDWTSKITKVDSLANLSPKTLKGITAMLCLEDLDEPFIKSFTSQSFSHLQQVVEHVRSILWIVKGSRADNPYHSATIGMGRSIAAESPHMHLQFLDIDRMKSVEPTITECLLRLIMADSIKLASNKNILWTVEQEVYLEDGKFVIPRIMPLHDLNDRLNSIRRVIKKDLEISEMAVEIVQSISSEGSVFAAYSGQHRDTLLSPSPDFVAFQTSISSLSAIRIHDGLSVYVALGSFLHSGEKAVAFLERNSSLALVPVNRTMTCQMDNENDFVFLESIVTYLVAKAIVEFAPDSGSTILHEPDELLELAVMHVAATSGKHIASTTMRDIAREASNVRYIHPRASKNTITARLPKDARLMIDFSTGLNQDHRIANSLPTTCAKERGAHFATAQSSIPDAAVTLGMLNNLLAEASQQYRHSRREASKPILPRLRPTELIAQQDVRSLLTLIDWTRDTSIPVSIRPLDPSALFTDVKTYLLFGLAGELGQSICRWMAKNGARHLVISSRNPQTDTNLRAELRNMGVSLRLEACDIANKRDVQRLYERLCQSMPPIAGVINGAMILKDKPFGDMTDEIFRDVLKPKVDGSKNLDEVFWDHPLDFFLMTSSTAAVLGNPGQANYASANQYMVGLAAQRRKRGVAACTVDIGMIMGIGYIRRSEDQGTYEHFLTKQSVLPMAEPDIHEVFAEAIRSGFTGVGERSEIMTALRKVNLSDRNQRPSWIENPRFSHHNYETEGAQSKSDDSGEVSIKNQLDGTSSIQETSETLQASFAAQLAVILQLPPDGVNKEVPLIEMGTDSLVAVEIRSWFLKEIGQDVPILTILNGASVADICDELAANLFLAGSGNDKASAGPTKSEPTLDKTATEKPLLAVTAVAGGNPSRAGNPPPANASSTQSSSSDDGSECNDTPDTAADSETETAMKKAPVCPWDRIEPMSYGQSRIWFPSLYLEDKTAYNCTTSYRLAGPLNVARFRKALRNLMQRHESFRTAFHTDSFTGEAKQDILAKSMFRLREIPVANDGSDVQREFRKATEHVYDLESGDVFIATLLTHSPGFHTIIFGYQHIIMDGVSWQLTLQDLERLYSSSASSLPPASQYADFSLKQQHLVSSGAYEKERAFWKSEFSTLPESLPLFPFAKSNSRKALTRYDTLDFVEEINPSLTAKIKQASRTAKVTTFHFYLATLEVLLHRFLDTEDMCFGITDANRTDPEFLGTIGFMLNFLPLRFNVKGEQKFIDIVQTTRNKAYAGLGRSSVPIDTILGDLDVPRSPSCPPLFQVIVNYRMGALKQKTMGDISLDWLDYQDARNPYDITLTIDEKDDGSGGYVSLSLLEYLFDNDHGDLLMKTYIHLLDQFASNPSMMVNDSRLFHDSERSEAVSLGAGPKLQMDWPETLSLRIDDLVKQHPNQMALKDTSHNELTYEQMADRVNVIASALQKIAQPGARVGVFCEPSTDVVCALLAIMRIGAIYVPLDCNSPVERLALICDEAKPSVIVYGELTASRVEGVKSSYAELLNISTLPGKVSNKVANVSKASETAFILFTSGSTGKPKGVVLTNSNYVAQVTAASKSMNLGKETVLQQSSFGFDLSLAQIFYALANGGTLILAINRGDPAELTALMLHEKVTFTFCVPSEYSVMLRYGSENMKKCSSWRTALSSGESFPTGLKEKFRDIQLSDLKVFNAFGPTEASIIGSVGEISYQKPDNEVRVHMGRALNNYSVYIVDEQCRPVPVGYPGEILLGGPAISSGYLNNELLTSQRFVPDSISPPGKFEEGWKTLYHTGDTAQMLKDGSVIYRGRMEGDLQIKLRGFRIELDDISNTILRSSNGALYDAAVVLKGTSDPFLVAFVVFAVEKEPKNSTSYLKNLLSSLPLSSYMKPAIFKVLKQMPTTASGKLDRRALNSMQLPGMADEESDTPWTETESYLKEIWVGLLSETGSLFKINKESDFFSVGGNSLLLLKLQADIRDKFSIDVPLAVLFQTNTLSALAAHIEARNSTTDTQSLDWDVESALPSELVSLDESSIVNRPVKTHMSVLLTGSTGFLGRSILFQLLKHNGISKIHCVAVRKQPDMNDSLFASGKVVVHMGDLSLPMLGLAEADMNSIFSNVDVIIHNGADVSFMKTYQSLRRPNVGSTKELIRLSAIHHTPFHFVSTAGVVHLSGQETYEERSVSPYPPPVEGSDGYVASKWASERLLEKVVEKFGTAAWIHRPTSVTGDDVPATDIVQNTLKYSRLMKAVPDLRGWSGYFDFVGVDSVAKGIVGVVLNHKLTAEKFEQPKYVHHCGEDVVEVKDMKAFVERQVGGEVRTLGWSDWIESARRLGLNELVATFMATLQKDEGTLLMPRLLKS